jgi:hypothetical protein
MEQRLENSTLIALRELRGYEKQRQLAERREEQAHQARERQEREQKAEEAAREQALEKQLRTDLQRAEDEIRLLKQEADRRMGEANHARQASQALASIPQAPASPVCAPSARRGSWLAASGGAALLASALVLLIGMHRNASMPANNSQQDPSCAISTVSAPAPTSAAAEPASTASALPPAVSDPVGSRRHRPTIPHPRRPVRPHASRKPNPPVCDGTDPLCGITVNATAP